MLFGVGVSCRILYSIFSYLYVSCSGSITSVGEDRANLLVIVWFVFGRFPLGMGCVILFWHSLDLRYSYLTHKAQHSLQIRHSMSFSAVCLKNFHGTSV